MADQHSVEMLAFNFANRPFAYRILAKGLSRSVFAFSSFIREYLDPVVKTDQCAEYVDDIGIATNIATDLTRNIRVVFKCIRQAGLKQTIEKCHIPGKQLVLMTDASFRSPGYALMIEDNPDQKIQSKR